MNFKKYESEKKLNGCYYTPDWLADFISKWIVAYSPKDILEPSCGDGVFVQALSCATKQNLYISCFDTDSTAIEQCQQRKLSKNISISLTCSDFLRWAVDNLKSDSPTQFDAVVGNPPFIRYQYMEKEIQDTAQSFFNSMGMKFTKHTNLWLPFILASVDFLRPGGHIGMIIPSEILNVLYAQGLRDYLLKECKKILLVDPEDLWFEDTLQGAMLLMAEKKRTDADESKIGIVRTVGRSFSLSNPLDFFEGADYLPTSYLSGKWSYALLTKEEAEAFSRVKSSTSVFSFSELADVDVGIVTGANKYFLVPDAIVKEYSLYDVVYPMFGRSEHCKGIIYDAAQHSANIEQGYPTNFVYFESETDGQRHQDYLAVGEAEGIPTRYKCRIRKPWFKVPSVYSSPVNMLKRSNGMPRLILNRLNAFNTDTAYRISPKESINPEKLVYCFINSLTALSAELEGRFYGGGVLELVPSEIERLLIPYVKDEAFDVDRLNTEIKTDDQRTILEKQDADIFATIPDVSMDDIILLHSALNRLQLRRQRMESHSSTREPANKKSSPKMDLTEKGYRTEKGVGR